MKTYYGNTRNIPYHIQAIGNLYTVMDVPNNLADGSIDRFLESESHSPFPIGTQFMKTKYIGNSCYDAVWLHLGNGYCKMIGLWPKSTDL